MERAQNLLVPAALALAGFGGLLHGPWLLAVISAATLVLVSLLSRQLVPHRYPASHRSLPDATIIAASVLNASAAASAAFMLGRVSGWVWGV